MKILALESATAACSAAAWVDGAIVAAERLETPRGQAEILLPMVERVRRAAGLPFGAFDRLAVSVGPGHFTGLRAGLAAARGLALAAGRPLVGVTTLSAIAAGVPLAERAGKVVLVALDSKRAQPYVQAFDQALQPLDRPAARDGDEYAAACVAMFGPERPLLVVGDAAAKLCESLQTLGVVPLASSAAPLPDAAWVANLAAEAPLPSGPPAPLYIHPVEITTPRPRPRRPASGVHGGQ